MLINCSQEVSKGKFHRCCNLSNDALEASSSVNFAAKMRQKTEMKLISVKELIFE